MSRWEDVLDHQVELWQFWRSPLGAGYANTYEGDKEQKYGRSIRGGPWLRELQELTMFHAEPIAIEPDMWTLIENAQLSFQPEPLREDDLITPFGFMFLPKPLFTADVWNNPVSYRAVAWTPMMRSPVAVPESPAMELAAEMMNPEVYGIFLSLYTFMDDPDHYSADIKATYPKTWATSMPMLTLAHYTPWEFGMDYTKLNEKRWETIHDHSVYETKGIKFEDAIANSAATFRQVQAIFRIMQQTIAVHASHHPDRPTRRRSLKAEYPEKDVTVIYLRRPKRDPNLDSTDHHEVNWQHRWLVAGHWRNQWFPSLSEHRQIWINPYVKGPEDKPLQVREKRAFVFGR